MAGEKDEPKSGLPGGFVLFLLAAVLLILTVQNFMDIHVGKVSFSYQLEHLVNLQLIEPEESRKIALNDNLVTFTGVFKQNLTEESKKRFKYLTLVDEAHTLKTAQADIDKELTELREKIKEAGSFFLAISGIEVPPTGYVVIDDYYNSPKHNNQVILPPSTKMLPNNLAALQKQLPALEQSPMESTVKPFAESLILAVKNFRSPTLGIGSVTIKQKLDQMDRSLQNAIESKNSPAELLKASNNVLQGLQEIATQLNTQEDHLRLSQLRSVRGYQEYLKRAEQMIAKLDETEMQLDKAREPEIGAIWFFNNSELSTRALEKQDPDIYHQWYVNAKEEWNRFDKNRGGVFKAPDQPLNLTLEKTFKSEEPSLNYFSYLFSFLPVMLVLFVLYYLFARQMKGVGSNALSFGKSPAKLLVKGSNKITFKDVAGVDEALEELQEIVEFLKNPQKFTALGGRIPKGVLCVGPPGTGKTLIAKAVAGEADRPFFSISGSDFVEMFVGVGASRIRDLFDQAKKSAPCIIFIDEIDAVGRHRGAGIGGGHDEREQTLNQLLVEMDGFDTNEGVILMAATNRPDVLDKALLRPGRFDRRVVINLPDIKGRFEILKVHARRIKLDSSVDLFAMARGTPGCSGADLGNLLNEAALAAARKGRNAVTNEELHEARDKVLYGKERRSLELDENEKMTTAYHEAGHAVVGLCVEHADPVDKVTIIPRGFSLGSTMFLPKKNRVSHWRKELRDMLAMMMGGRVAEEIFLGDVSSGAQNDIERATHIARSMVCEWGMSEALGTVTYDERAESGQYLGMGGFYEKKYSEATAQLIDSEVKTIVADAYAYATQIINTHREQLITMAKMLMEFETLNQVDVERILNGTWTPEEKRQELQAAADLQKKNSVVPPPPPPDVMSEPPSATKRKGEPLATPL